MRRPAKRTPMDVTPEMLLADLKRVYLTQGEKMTTFVYRRHGTYSDSALTRRFGSWNRALALAGIPQNCQTCKPPTDEAAFQPIEKPKRHRCPKCDKFHVSINYTCLRCSRRTYDGTVAEGWEAVC